MTTVVLVLLAGLLGLHIGATWPQLAFFARHPSRVQETAMSAPLEAQPPDQPLDQPSNRRQLLVLTWLLVGTMLGTFVVAVLMVVQRAQLAESTRDAVAYQRCQANYSTAFQEAYKARADASIATTEGLDGVIKAVRDALNSGDASALAAAVTNYLAVRAEQTRERSQNPLPPLPEQVCGPAPTED